MKIHPASLYRGSRILALLPFLSPLAAAEEISFDRPGISFSPGVLSQGRIIWEQGLPDVEHEQTDDLTSTLYSPGTLVRLGLGAGLELQLGTTLANRLDIKKEGAHDRETGAGDSSIAVKYQVPLASEAFTLGLLGGSTIKTGKGTFNDDPQLSLGSTVQWQVNDTQAAALYLNMDRIRDESTFTISPNWGISWGEKLGTFIEMGLTIPESGPSLPVAGGGLTWMPLECLQLDFYADFGLNEPSPDLQYGLGFALVLR